MFQIHHKPQKQVYTRKNIENPCFYYYLVTTKWPPFQCFSIVKFVSGPATWTPNWGFKQIPNNHKEGGGTFYSSRFLRPCQQLYFSSTFKVCPGLWDDCFTTRIWLRFRSPPAYSHEHTHNKFPENLVMCLFYIVICRFTWYFEWIMSTNNALELGIRTKKSKLELGTSCRQSWLGLGGSEAWRRLELGEGVGTW